MTTIEVLENLIQEIQSELDGVNNAVDPWAPYCLAEQYDHIADGIERALSIVKYALEKAKKEIHKNDNS